MGEHKYEYMDIEYPLKGTTALSVEKKKHAVELFKNILSCKVV
jgi:hypothetical protein